MEKISLETKFEKIHQLPTLFLNLPGSSSGSIQLWFRAGSALETTDNQGIAHFLEHMFFKGTSRRPDNGPAKEVDQFGGEFNAFTSFDYTCYYINAPTEFLKQSTDILIDMVSNPQFLEKDLPAERGVVLEEFKRSVDSAHHHQFHLIQKHSFPEGYEHAILGREDTITQFTIEQLKYFREKYYSLANCLLIISGNLGELNNTNLKNFSDVIATHKLPKGNESSFGNFTLKNISHLTQAQTHVWGHHKHVQQLTLSMVLQGPSYNDEFAAAEDLALNCLGHGESSPMIQSLVKKTSFCSGANASTMFFNKGGTHFIKLVMPEKNLKKSLETFKSLLLEIMEKGFSEKELTKIKNQYIASKVYELESVESLAFSLGHSYAQTGDIESEKIFLEKIKNCSLKDVNDSLKRIINRLWHYHLQIPENLTLKAYLDEIEVFDKKKKTLEKNNNKISNQIKNTATTYQVKKIKPGITFIHRYNTQTPTFALQCYMEGGLAFETKSDMGHYHLLGRMLTSGYQGTSAIKLKEDLDFKSASLAGFSGKNSYGLVMHGQSIHSEILFQHFFGCLLKPTFEEKLVKLEKELILRALKNQKEDPVKSCFREFSQLYYGKHSYGFDALGNKETLLKMNPKTLAKLHSTNLTKRNLVIAYSGDSSFEEMSDLVTQILLPLKNRKITKHKLPKFQITKPITRFIPFKREQTHLFVGFSGYSLNHSDGLLLKILTAYLSGQSSQLFLEMRDKRGLCYAVQAVHHNALLGGHWGIYIGTSNEKREEAKLAIRELLLDLGKKGIGQVELDNVKSMVTGQNILSVQTNEDYVSRYAIPTLYGLPPDYEWNQLELIKKCPLNKFNHFIKKFLNTATITIEVGKKS